jgi:hypothetical protein
MRNIRVLQDALKMRPAGHPRIRRAPRLFPFMLQCLIVRRKRIGREIGGLLVVARLAARVNAARRPSGIERIGGESFLLLDDFRNFLKLPIFGIRYRCLVAPSPARDVGGRPASRRRSCGGVTTSGARGAATRQQRLRGGHRESANLRVEILPVLSFVKIFGALCDSGFLAGADFLLRLRGAQQILHDMFGGGSWRACAAQKTFGRPFSPNRW